MIAKVQFMLQFKAQTQNLVEGTDVYSRKIQHCSYGSSDDSVWKFLITAFSYKHSCIIFGTCSPLLQKVLGSSSVSSQAKNEGTCKAPCLSSYKWLLPFKVVSGLKSILYTHCSLFSKG